MYRSIGLRFPRLDFVRDVTFDKGENKTTALFRLDWSESDKFHENYWMKWVEDHAYASPSKKIDFVCKFPDAYERTLQSAFFAIPKPYLAEIHRMTQQAIVEWNAERTFDTSIREMCLKPAISFIECSFDLISDCLYDFGTNYYTRGHKKYIIRSLMLYRFWQHQTGRGMIESRAQFEALEKWAEDSSTPVVRHGTIDPRMRPILKKQDEESVEISKDLFNYIEAMRAYHQELDAMYGRACPGPVVEVVGKSIEPTPAVD